MKHSNPVHYDSSSKKPKFSGQEAVSDVSLSLHSSQTVPAPSGLPTVLQFSKVGSINP